MVEPFHSAIASSAINADSTIQHRVKYPFSIQVIFIVVVVDILPRDPRAFVPKGKPALLQPPSGMPVSGLVSYKLQIVTRLSRYPRSASLDHSFVSFCKLITPN